MKVRFAELAREYWNTHAAEYYREHPEHLLRNCHPSWGLTHTPEADLRLVPAPVKDPTYLLDLGCGQGHDGSAFAQLGYTVLGVDLAEQQLSFAPRAAGISYTVSDARRLPIRRNVVDVAVSDHGAFDHSPCEPLLREVKRVLSPGGLLVVCVYSDYFWISNGGSWAQHMTPRSYAASQIMTDGRSVSVAISTPELLRRLLNYGFSIIRVEAPLLPCDAPFPYDRQIPREFASKWPIDVMVVAANTS